jgi:hypothetical protein
MVLHALDAIRSEIGPNGVEITSDFLGVVPSGHPVDLIHLFTAGPHEALIQIALKPGTIGDIVSQVMGFGSPTPIEVAVLGTSLKDDYAYAQKVRNEMAKLPFLRDLQFAQEANYPTMDIRIDRDRAGQFGLTMADVVNSIVPATSSSRFTQPNYWQDPNSGQAFRFKSSSRRIACRASTKWARCR